MIDKGLIKFPLKTIKEMEVIGFNFKAYMILEEQAMKIDYC